MVTIVVLDHYGRPKEIQWEWWIDITEDRLKKVAIFLWNKKVNFVLKWEMRAAFILSLTLLWKQVVNWLGIGF